MFLNLFGLLQNRRMCGATDPRDKVYALLGVAQDKIAQQIEVNYRTPVDDVFIEVSRSIIGDHKSLMLLGFKHLRRLSTFDNFPSWAIDWKDTEDRTPAAGYLGEQNQNGSGRYIAAGQTQPCVIDVGSARKLGLRGYAVATISEVGQICTPDTQDHSIGSPVDPS
jgi:hypothetical protein